MAASVLGADVDRRAATRAMNGADACGQGFYFCRNKLAYKPLFDHELREGRETAMILQAAVVGKATTAHDIMYRNQRVPAMWAMQGGGMLTARVIAVCVDQLEQVDDAPRADQSTFKRIEPDALAGEANIKRQRGKITPG